MLWRPTTDGEDLFLRLYEGLGDRLVLHGPDDGGLAFLVAPVRFTEFTRLAATLEVFLRCIRRAKDFFELEGHLPAARLGSMLGRDIGIPARLYRDRQFCESAKQAGKIASTRPRPKSIEQNAMRAEPRTCYLCGVALTRTVGAHDHFTIEHLWPLSLGGATVEDNLLPACKNCNDTRKHFITWAWGPVQSTYHARSDNEAPPRELRLSLALARLMLVAAGRSNAKRLLTLKEAAKKIGPVVSPLELKHGHHYVYFELFPQIEALL
jgi:hypothetical protein